MNKGNHSKPRRLPKGEIPTRALADFPQHRRECTFAPYGAPVRMLVNIKAVAVQEIYSIANAGDIGSYVGDEIVLNQRYYVVIFHPYAVRLKPDQIELAER